MPALDPEPNLRATCIVERRPVRKPGFINAVLYPTSRQVGLTDGSLRYGYLAGLM